jgi:hypothetical protein
VELVLFSLVIAGLVAKLAVHALKSKKVSGFSSRHARNGAVVLLTFVIATPIDALGEAAHFVESRIPFGLPAAAITDPCQNGGCSGFTTTVPSNVYEGSSSGP